MFVDIFQLFSVLPSQSKYNKYISSYSPPLACLQSTGCNGGYQEMSLLQNTFYNGNLNRKHPNNNTTVHLTLGFYGILERNHTLSVEDFFPRGIFISKESIEEKIEARLVQLGYNSLKSHIKSKIGQH